MVKGRVYEEVDLMREARAEGDVVADIAAEELQAYLGNHPSATMPTYIPHLKGQSHEIFCTWFFSSISSFWSH